MKFERTLNSRTTIQGRVTGALLLILMTQGTMPAWAGGKAINVQGKLTDSAGNALSGSQVVTFRLYKNLSGLASNCDAADPNCVWSETQGITPQNGLFNATLGSATSLNPVPFNTPYYLGMQVAGDPNELQPRQLLGASAYALGSLGDFTVGGGLSVNGTDVATNLVPAGTILPYGGTAAPSGFLLCDGSVVSRNTYAALFAAVGTAWGSGDGFTTFNLPDLRGRFLRGVDGGAGRDPDRASRTPSNPGGNAGDAAGSIEGESFKNHTHTADPHNHGINDPGHSHVYTYFSYEATGTPPHIPAGDPLSYDPKGFSTSTSLTGITLQNTIVNIQGTGGSETRPQNAGVGFIIAVGNKSAVGGTASAATIPNPTSVDNAQPTAPQAGSALGSAGDFSVGRNVIVSSNAIVGGSITVSSNVRVAGSVSANGVLSAAGLAGTTAADDAAEGNVGQSIKALVPYGPNMITLVNNVYSNIASIDLTPGDWDVTGLGMFYGTGVTTASVLLLSTQQLTNSDYAWGDNLIEITPPGTVNGNFQTGVIPNWRVSTTVPKTIYLKAAASISTGSTKTWGRITARRMR